MSKKAIVAATAAAALLLAACGSSTSAEDPATSVTADSSYFYTQVEDLRSRLDLDVIEPQNLLAALPNHRLLAPLLDPLLAKPFSDLLVVGTVTDVRKGDAVKHGEAEDSITVVDFDDPDAVERNVVVTVDPEQVAGTSPGPGPIEFRMGVLSGADPETFLASIQDMTRIVVVLKKRQDGRHEGDYMPLMSGALLGTVDTAGLLSFPALGALETTFIGTLNTVDKLLTEALKPLVDLVVGQDQIPPEDHEHPDEEPTP